MTRKTVRLFPYTCELSGTENSVDNIKNLFSRENAIEGRNIKKYYDDAYLVMIIEDAENNFLFGRFLKLRDAVPSVFNRSKGTERTIDILSEENIKEQSHFIWNVNDKIIFAEYNYQAIRHFTSPLKFYFDKMFDVNDNIITPIIDKDTFEKLKTESIIKSLKLKVTKDNVNKLEEKFGIKLRTLVDLARDNRTIFEIIVKKSRVRESSLEKNKVIEISENLKQTPADLETLQVQTKDTVYDLINNNLLYYFTNLEYSRSILDANEFYRKAKDIYIEKIDNIKAAIESSN